jgi:hypothetical protein
MNLPPRPAFTPAQPPPSDGAAILASVGSEAGNILTALLATGLSLGEAFRTALGGVPNMPWEEVRPVWLEQAGAELQGPVLADALDALAERDPALATQALASLPEGFRILEGLGQTFSLEKRAWVHTFPDRLAIECAQAGGHIAVSFDGCENLERLPAGLKVGGSISLQGCGHWDRELSEGTYIAGRIWTDEYPWDLYANAETGVLQEDYHRDSGGGWGASW